jgi:hypothetical protein
MKNYRFLATVACTGIIAGAGAVLTFPAIADRSVRLNSFPLRGKVLQLTNGDLMCYVEIDTRGKKYHLGADFEICNQTKFLNKQVQITYKYRKVNDCQSNEPCGKTRIKNLIVKMKLVPK